MKNENTIDVVRDALSEIDFAVHDLRMTAWAMDCTSDPSHKLPEGCHVSDVGFFFAKMLGFQAQRISSITATARDNLEEMRRVAR